MMSASKKISILILLVLTFTPFQWVGAQEPTPAAPLVAPDPGEIINAINSLRLAYGLAPLNVNPILMEVAQEEANGIASGLPGHWRPNGMTLGQWLLSKGYPLLGDLSLDGYRSENWVAASSLEEALAFWQSDEPHLDTMISTERSDLGVGVAVSDQIYMVLETAWQTSSGKMQSDAYPILTSISMTQGAYSAIATQSEANGTSSEYMFPVAVNTPMPGGDVYHEVQYGQSMWSIAINYHTTIKQIQQLNNLQTTDVNVGQKLLIVRGATPSAPRVAGVPNTPSYSSDEAMITMMPTVQMPSTDFSKFASEPSPQNSEKDMLGMIAIFVAALFMGGVFIALMRKKP
ncbi:MAG: LysM peptidoglycan-binding domain-containing protein [Anaerolineales bacterium]